MKGSLLLALMLLCFSYSLQAQTTCNQPVITAVTGAGTYCPGEEVTLELTGNLNDATTWTWYTGSCGGESVGTGTAITVTVEESETYFVRGIGGCVGNSAACDTVEVKLDDIGPEILSCQADTVVANEDGQCGAIVSFDPPVAMDACSDTVFVEQVAGPASGSFFPIGVTDITYELRDTLDNISICTFKITVADQEAPTITCPANIEVNNEPGKCGAVVTYEVPVGSDNCPDAVTELTEGLGSGAFFPVGVTTETYTVIDASGNSSSCSFTVTVKDVEPPVIKVHDRETELWPPNHKHHGIAIGGYIKSVSDNCGGITMEDVIIDEVGSDEPNNGTGDGNTTDDILITEDCHNVKLLAERSGNGNGRVYVVKLAVMDLHGNIGTAEFTVEVPHDKGKKHTTIQDSIVYVENGCDLIWEEDTTGNPSGRETESGRIDAYVYPNPFNESFTITLKPTADDHIKVELYNMIGIKVSDLHEQQIEANRSYTWTFDIAALKANQYFLLIRGTKTQKMVRIIQQE